MARIREISIGDVSLSIAPEDKDDPFSGFFGIDSFNVLLGKNGSGKTTFLTSVARAISQKKGTISFLVDSAPGERSRLMNEQDRENHGVLFFTALPYRRKVPQNRRVIDASPNLRHGDFGDIDVFKRVSFDLGITTSLQGYVSYSSAVFFDVLVPALLSSGEARAQSQYFSRTWETALTVLESSQNDKSSLPATRERDLRQAKLRLGNEVRMLLLDVAWNRRRLVQLAVLEKLASSSRNSAALGVNFLIHLGILRSIDRKVDASFVSKFDQIVEGTLAYLDRQKAVQESVDELSFEISTNSDTTESSRSNTAVQVRWSDLSSGMLALVEQFTQVRRGIETICARGIGNVLVLIDEGDAYLHLDWQRRYIELLDRFLSAIKSDLKIHCLQTVLATHSPVIATDLPSSMVTNLDAGVDPQRTFAAPIDEVMLSSFGSSSIGTFAASKINALHSRLISGAVTGADEMLLDEIGDVLIKNALLRARRERRQ